MCAEHYLELCAAKAEDHEDSRSHKKNGKSSVPERHIAFITQHDDTCSNELKQSHNIHQHCEGNAMQKLTEDTSARSTDDYNGCGSEPEAPCVGFHATEPKLLEKERKKRIEAHQQNGRGSCLFFAHAK